MSLNNYNLKTMTRRTRIYFRSIFMLATDCIFNAMLFQAFFLTRRSFSQRKPYLLRVTVTDNYIFAHIIWLQYFFAMNCCEVTTLSAVIVFLCGGLRLLIACYGEVTGRLGVLRGGDVQVRCLTGRWCAGSVSYGEVTCRFSVLPGGDVQVRCLTGRWRAGWVYYVKVSFRFGVLREGDVQVRCLTERWRAGSVCYRKVTCRFSVLRGDDVQVGCITGMWRAGSVSYGKVTCRFGVLRGGDVQVRCVTGR